MIRYQDDWIQLFVSCQHSSAHLHDGDYYCPGCDQFYRQHPKLLRRRWKEKVKEEH